MEESNINNDEEKAIGDILSEGIKNIYSFTNNQILTKRIQSKPIISRSNSSVFQIETQMEKIQRKVHGQENILHSILCSSPIAKRNDSNINFNLSHMDINRRDILKRTQSILSSKSNRRNYPNHNGLSVRSSNISRDKDHNMKILQQETNMLWKEKYEALNKEYDKVKASLSKERKHNKTYSYNITCRKKKKEELNQLLQWELKLTNINNTLKSQYDITNEKIDYQNGMIVKLNRKLMQLRSEFQSKTPIN